MKKLINLKRPTSRTRRPRRAAKTRRTKLWFGFLSWLLVLAGWIKATVLAAAREEVVAFIRSLTNQG